MGPASTTLEILVHLRLHGHDAQSPIVPSKSHYVGVRRSFTSFKRDLPFREGSEHLQPEDVFVAREIEQVRNFMRKLVVRMFP